MNNWTVIKKSRHSGSRYTEYYSKMCVIVVGVGDMVLPRPVYDALGAPTYVEVLEDVRNKLFALRPATSEYAKSTAFKVGAVNGRDNVYGAMRISPLSFTKTHGLNIKGRGVVYNATINDEGLVVVNMAQKPEVV